MIVDDATQDADATVMGTIVNANFWDLEKCCPCITVLYCIAVLYCCIVLYCIVVLYCSKI